MTMLVFICFLFGDPGLEPLPWDGAWSLEHAACVCHDDVCVSTLCSCLIDFLENDVEN